MIIANLNYSEVLTSQLGVVGGIQWSDLFPIEPSELCFIGFGLRSPNIPNLPLGLEFSVGESWSSHKCISRSSSHKLSVST